jgi:hypothetical protein
MWGFTVRIRIHMMVLKRKCTKGQEGYTERNITIAYKKKAASLSEYRKWPYGGGSLCFRVPFSLFDKKIEVKELRTILYYRSISVVKLRHCYSL